MCLLKHTTRARSPSIAHFGGSTGGKFNTINTGVKTPEPEQPGKNECHNRDVLFFFAAVQSTMNCITNEPFIDLPEAAICFLEVVIACSKHFAVI